MHKYEKGLSAAVICVTLAIAFALCGMSLGTTTDANRDSSPVVTLDHWSATATDPSGAPIPDAPAELQLPCNLYDFEPGSVVTLHTQAELPQIAAIYLTTQYAPYTLWVDGVKVATYGGADTYANFLADPPPESAVHFANTGEGLSDITVSYTVPEHYWGLRLTAGYAGDYEAVRQILFVQMGAEMFLSLILAGIGIVLVVLAGLIRGYRRASGSFGWLGALAICLGLWIFGECDLTGVIMKRPALLHMLTYIGAFGTLVPITHLTRSIMGRPSGLLTHILCRTSEVYVLAVFLLQALGIWQFSESFFTYYVIATLLILATFSHAVYLLIRNPSSITRLRSLYLVALFGLGIMFGMELLNYYNWHLLTEMSFIGIATMVFVVFMSLASANFLRDSIGSHYRNQLLEERMAMNNRINEAKMRQSQMVIDANAELRRLRHDIKHQLSIIGAYNADGEREKLTQYLEEIGANLPTTNAQRYCTNLALNAVVEYYIDLAKSHGIDDVTVIVDLPEGMDRQQENDACVVVGNLLENAIRACDEVLSDPDAKQKPFIRMVGRSHNGMATIAQDNPYVRTVKNDDGEFQTTRSEGGGVGLESISILSKRWGGAARFEAADGIFHSSAYIQLKMDEGPQLS